MYHYYYNLLPSSFENFFQTVASVHSYNTRLASESTYYINTIKTNYGKFNIRFAAVKVWNHLDESIKYLPLRAVFIWVSKVIRVLLWFCFTSLCDWLKNLAPLSRPIRSKTQTNQSRLARARTFFPALDASNMYLLRVLIGSLGNLCLLWLAGVITLVLVLRHSFEKRSIMLTKFTYNKGEAMV